MQQPDDLQKRMSDLKFKNSPSSTELLNSGSADKNLAPSTSKPNYTEPQWSSTNGAEQGSSLRRTTVMLMTFLALCLVTYCDLPLIAPLLKLLAPPLICSFFFLGFLLRLAPPVLAGSPPSAYRQFLVRALVTSICTIPIYICSVVAMAQMGTSANSYLKQGQYEKSLAIYNQLDDINSPMPFYKQKKADCYYHLGKYQMAVENYSSAIKEDATAELLLARAKSFKAMGDRISAQKDEAAADKIQKDNTPTVQDLWDNKQYTEALPIYNQMVAKSPTSSKTYVSRGKCFYELKQYRNALDDFDKAIALYPKFGQALYERSRAYEKLGQKRLAMKDKTHAKKLGYKPAPVTADDDQ